MFILMCAQLVMYTVHCWGGGKLYLKIFYICHGLEQYFSTLMFPNLLTKSH